LENLTWDKVNVYSSFVEHIANQNTDYEHFVGGYINKENLLNKIQNRPSIDRNILVQHFKQEYQSMLALNDVNEGLIDSLSNKNTFTLTTGHQICFLSGPMYLPIKIFQTINLAKKFKALTPEFNFVPIYWMATEDHDYEEIQSTFLFDKKVSIDNINEQVKVGTVDASVIQQVLKGDVNEILCRNEVGSELYQIIQKIFKKSKTLKEFMFHLCRKLFGEDEFLILDADSSVLKKAAEGVFQKELKEQAIQKSVLEFEPTLNKYLPTSISPRNINLFAFEGNHRFRLEEVNGEVVNADTEQKVEVEQLLLHPENISPNVLCRPLYQEAILPNLAYIGGAAELGYWAELTTAFKNFELQQPFVVLRNSVMVVEKHDLVQLDECQLALENLFLPDHQLTDKLLINNGTNLEFREVEAALEAYINVLLPLSTNIDFTLKAHIEKHHAQEVRFLKKLKKDLKKRALANDKTKVDQLLKLKTRLLPNGKLNERKTNVLQYIVQYGWDFLPKLKEASGAESEGLAVIHTA
jgi:bacillithiol biosynthesis cysteine-adding enzyme BshC